jgi:hypothetical protein
LRSALFLDFLLTFVSCLRTQGSRVELHRRKAPLSRAAPDSRMGDTSSAKTPSKLPRATRRAKAWESRRRQATAELFGIFRHFLHRRFMRHRMKSGVFVHVSLEAATSLAGPLHRRLLVRRRSPFCAEMKSSHLPGRCCRGRAIRPSLNSPVALRGSRRKKRSRRSGARSLPGSGGDHSAKGSLRARPRQPQAEPKPLRVRALAWCRPTDRPLVRGTRPISDRRVDLGDQRPDLRDHPSAEYAILDLLVSRGAHERTDPEGLLRWWSGWLQVAEHFRVRWLATTWKMGSLCSRG